MGTKKPRQPTPAMERPVNNNSNESAEAKQLEEIIRSLEKESGIFLYSENDSSRANSPSIPLRGSLDSDGVVELRNTLLALEHECIGDGWKSKLPRRLEGSVVIGDARKQASSAPIAIPPRRRPPEETTTTNATNAAAVVGMHTGHRPSDLARHRPRMTPSPPRASTVHHHHRASPLRRRRTLASSSSGEMESVADSSPPGIFDNSPAWSPDTRKAYNEFGMFGLLQRHSQKVNHH